MSRILQNGREAKDIRKISVTIISNSFYCEKLKQGIERMHTTKENEYKLNFVKAECVQDMLEFQEKVPIDFIVFAIDTSISANIHQLKEDLELLDKRFLIGRICFVNVTNFFQNRVLIKLTMLANSFKIPLINGDIKKPDKCHFVAKRIIALIDANIMKSIPYVLWATS